MTRFLTLTALLALAAVALAQPPSAVANRIFDRLYAEQTSCQSSEALSKLSEGSEIVYCAYVADTMTDFNRTLVDDAYESVGYRPVSTDGWHVDWMDFGELHMRGQMRGTTLSITSLILFYELDGTIVIVSFDSLD